MDSNPRTTDAQGFDYMANAGREEQDRDACGMVIALGLVLALSVLQYCGLY